MAQMANVPEAERTARFHSSVVLVCGDEVLRGDGDCEGLVGFEPRGDGGFGYDPLFLPSDSPPARPWPSSLPTRRTPSRTASTPSRTSPRSSRPDVGTFTRSQRFCPARQIIVAGGACS